MHQSDPQYAAVSEKLSNVVDRLEKIEAAQEKLVEQWNCVNGVLVFVKWASGVGASLAALFVAFKTQIFRAHT